MYDRAIAERARLRSQERYAIDIGQKPRLLDEGRRVIAATIAENGGTAGQPNHYPCRERRHNVMSAIQVSVPVSGLSAFHPSTAVHAPCAAF